MANREDVQMIKIAITGGPCAGKSTALTWIRDEYEKRGWNVYIVGEIATSVAIGNASPHEFKDPAAGQAAMFFKQVADEEFYETVALDNAEPGDKILIVCDRGAVDAFAFLDPVQQHEFTEKVGISRRKMMERYDAVFHLVSAAIGAGEYYTRANNEARIETLEEAAVRDRLTIKAWTGHAHLRIIDNSTDFHGKMMRLLGEISVITGDPTPYEIERKFLIERPSDDEMRMHNGEESEILQTYLEVGELGERRLRQRGVSGAWTYTMTTKRETTDPTARVETEKRLTEYEYLELLMEADTSLHQIRKTRWCVPHKSKYFEIDLYPFSDEYAIMEVELSDIDENFEMPPFVNVIKEVTDDPAYRNKTISQNRKL